MQPVPRPLSVLLAAALLCAAAGAAHAGDATVAGAASAHAGASTWIAVQAPLSGDDDHDGYSTFELALSPGGPFDSAAAGWGVLGGPSEWRTDHFGRGLIAPGTSYFVRVTYVDPDGVSGLNPQILGPVTTPASSPNAVTVGAAAAAAALDEIFVGVPVADDADRDHRGTIDVATSAAGPWTRKCGSPSESNLPFHPKLCRIRSLSPGTDYWVRVTIQDGDGVAGANPQVLGPIRYQGLTNLALGRPISADSGWGCCPSPSHLVDGRIQNDAWFFGFAWTGGTSCWAGGCPPGFKQATVDLGAPTAVDRGVVWYHDPSNVPVVWKFQVSNDGATWTDVHSESDPTCRTLTQALPGYWGHPACGHDATFTPVLARYFRYAFDDRTLFGGIHGWAVEIEVFDSSEAAPANQPPVADAGGDRVVGVGSDCTAGVVLDGSASFDPDGDDLAYTWSGPFGTGAGETLAVTLPPGEHAVTLTVDDGRGGLDSDQAMITVVDDTPPAIAAAAATPDVLWPPNHELRPVAVGVAVADACDPAPACAIAAITSDEPVDGTGDGDTAPDWVISGDLTALLRAERAGGGDGRVYTLEVACTDAAGNAAAAAAQVTVPHDRGQ